METPLRSQQEILDRIEEIKKLDFFGTERSDLALHLLYDNAKEFLKPDVDKESWDREVRGRRAVLDEMRDYMTFALGKIEDHRGLSAGRSISHFRAWLWLLNDDELLEFSYVTENYRNYGAPILRRIGEKYGIALPNESWFENMSYGLPCKLNCEDGCGMKSE